MIRAAIIGLGDISAVHISAIEKSGLAVICAGCDIDESRKSVLPPNANFYVDYKKMIEDEKPDVVHICLPHHLHYPVAAEVLKFGCHIFAEKPLALNSEEALEYAELENQTKSKICLCLQNRFNNTTTSLLDIIKSEKYGKIVSIHANVAWSRHLAYYQAKPWRASMALAGGGCMINQAIHTMDLIQYFANSQITELKGNISKLQPFDVEVEDTAIAKISFANGIDASFFATVASAVDSPVNITVKLEKAQFIINGRVLYIKDGNSMKEIAKDDEGFFGKACYGSSHARLVSIFYRSILGEDLAYPTAKDGVVSMQMIDAVRKSSEIETAVKITAGKSII